MNSSLPHATPSGHGGLRRPRRHQMVILGASAIVLVLGLWALVGADSAADMAVAGGVAVAGALLVLVSVLLIGRASNHSRHPQWGDLITAMPMPVLLVRADDGAVIARSKALATLRGDGSAGGFISGESGLESWLETAETLRQRLAEHGTVDDLATHLRRSDGSRLPVLVSARTMESGPARHLIVTIADPSDRADPATARPQPSRTQGQGKAPFGWSRPEFLANISHELRTPLNAIIGFSKLMEDRLFGDLGAPQYVEYARDIHASGLYLLRAINDILDFSSIQAGQVEVDLQPVDVGSVVHWAVRAQGDKAAAAGHTISLHIDPELPALRADERHLRKCLLYVLSNAIKFTPGPGQITVRARLIEDGGCRITISDTGIGIPPERLDHTLQPFSQAEDALTRSYGGTGLGLAITKSLVELHGGSFSIVSTLGEGTEASMCFPSDLTLPAAAQPSSAA